MQAPTKDNKETVMIVRKVEDLFVKKRVKVVNMCSKASDVLTDVQQLLVHVFSVVWIMCHHIV